MISTAIIRLCREIRASGGRALLVGGWVRDYLRGRETADYDVEVYGIEAARLLELLRSIGSVNTVGEAFTVYKVRLRDEARRFVVDVSLPRRESKVGRGHKGFIVNGDPWMSYGEAARRRDFTINAMMYDPLAEEYIDPYDGRADLERRLIRVVDPRTFVEDSLRVLRAMQFASRFEFEIESGTIELCRSIDLTDLPAERIRAEVEKWLLQSDRPSIGLVAARSLGIIDRMWPELRGLIGCPTDSKPDCFSDTARTLDEARKLIDDLPGPKALTVMLAALCREMDKSVSGSEPARTAGFLERLKIFTQDGYDVRAQVLALVGHGSTPGALYESQPVPDGAFRRLALEVEPGLLHRLDLAARLGRGESAEPSHWFIERVRRLGVEVAAPSPLLLGRHVLDLGIKPGPRVGEITRAVYELQLDGEIETLDQAISAARLLANQ